jgi:hypothetical protein
VPTRGADRGWTRDETRARFDDAGARARCVATTRAGKAVVFELSTITLVNAKETRDESMAARRSRSEISARASRALSRALSRAYARANSDSAALSLIIFTQFFTINSPFSVMMDSG